MPSPTAPLFKVSNSSRTWLSTHLRDPYVKSRQSHPAQYRSRSAFKLIELHEKYGNFLTKNMTSVVDLGAAPGGWSQVVAGKMGWTEEREIESFGASPSGWGTRGRGGKLQSEKGGIRGMELAEGERKPNPYDTFYDGADNAKVPSAPGRGTIVAADLLHMSPIPGVRALQIDFLSPEAGELIRGMLMTASNPEGKADLILSDMAANFTGNKSHDTESSLNICMAVFEFARKNLRSMDDNGKMYTGTLL